MLQKELLETMKAVETQLQERVDNAKALVATNKETLSVANYISAIQALTLENIRVAPRFHILKKELVEGPMIKRAERIDFAVRGNSNSNGNGFIYNNLNQGTFDQWEDEVSEVRDGMKNIHQLSMFQTAIDKDMGKVAVLQMESSKSEVIAGNWLGLSVDDESELQDMDSIVLYNAEAYNPQYRSGGLSLASNAGLVVDSWLEYIPYKKHNAGLVFHVDRPDNEAPQAVLVAINHNINVNPSNFEHTQATLPGTTSNVVNQVDLTKGRLCWCPACRKESLRYRDSILNQSKNISNTNPARTNNNLSHSSSVVCEGKWDVDSLLGILDETRFMMMNRVVDPDGVYTNKKLSPIFPLLSEIIFENLKGLNHITGSTSGFYKNKLMMWDVFDAISGGKNIRG
jgi:hypothetical protein